MVVAGRAGERTIAAADLFQDYLTTAVEDGEILTEVRLPSARRLGRGLREVQPPRGGLGDGRRLRGGAQGARRLLRGRARRADQHGRACRCGRPRPSRRCAAARSTPRPIAAAAEHAAEGTDPPEDLNASAEYKRHLARVLCRRALEEAAAAA